MASIVTPFFVLYVITALVCGVWGTIVLGHNPRIARGFAKGCGGCCRAFFALLCCYVYQQPPQPSSQSDAEDRGRRRRRPASSSSTTTTRCCVVPGRCGVCCVSVGNVLTGLLSIVGMLDDNFEDDFLVRLVFFFAAVFNLGVGGVLGCGSCVAAGAGAGPATAATVVATLMVPMAATTPPQQQWFYRDLQGTVQGPFHQQVMWQWRQQGYFTGDVPVSHSQCGPFVRLQDAFANASSSSVVQQGQGAGAAVAATADAVAAATTTMHHLGTDKK